MLHALRAAVVAVAAGFQNVVEADDIRLDVDVRVVDAVAHARLCREVDDDIGVIVGKDAVYKCLIRDGTLEERPNRPRRVYGGFLDLPQAVVLERRVIVVV